MNIVHELDLRGLELYCKKIMNIVQKYLLGSCKLPQNKVDHATYITSGNTDAGLI